MANFFKSDSFKFWLFAFAVFLTRLPFLSEGYGLDDDSWSVAITARNISETGSFEVSRFPGFPVHEFICSLFYNGYAFRLNLLTAFISTVGFLFFALTLRVWKFKYVFLATSALAFTKIVYINSTTTIDYTWALTFILISLYFIAKHKHLQAGIFLGIAIGCRITSGALLIPYAIMLLQPGGVQKNAITISKFLLSSIITALLLFLPVFIKYGWAFFTYYDIVYPSIYKVLYKFFFDTWGLTGCFGLLAATVLLFMTPAVKSRKYLFPRSINEKYVIAWLIAIDLYIIAFLRFPVEAGYLVPMVPFIILLFGKYLYNNAFRFFAITLIVSSFLFSVNPVNRNDAPTPSKASFIFNGGTEKLFFDALEGPIFSYESRRKNGMLFTNQILTSIDTLKGKSLIVSGKWFNQIYLQREEDRRRKTEDGRDERSSVSDLPTVQFIDYVTQDTLLSFIEKGYNIYYLPQQDMNNLLMRNVDISLYGAEPYLKNKIKD